MHLHDTTEPGPDAPWAWPVIWVGAVALAGTLLVTSGRSVFDAHLRGSAERTAVDYAAVIGASVPQLTPLLERGEPTAAALAQLRRLRDAGSVFRFRLFDREGRLALVSDRLAMPESGSGGAAPDDLAGGHDDLVGEKARVLTDGVPVVELADGRGVADRPDHYSEAYVPLLIDGGVAGVIEVYVDQTALALQNRNAFLATTMATVLITLGLGVLGVVQLVRRRSDQRRTERRMSYLARHDALSGALNRTSFAEALEAAVVARDASGDAGSTFAVLCLDLDRFKEVNDALGHAAGDEVLRRTTLRLQALLRHGDRLARLGGDEFAILQVDVEGANDVRTLAERIVASLAEPYLIDGRDVPCGASVGAALFGTDATDLQALMHKADLALYRAKTDGRGAFSFYDAELDGRLRERRELAADLRAAVDACELTLHYQDLFAADGVRVVGREALLRWSHPERGPISPEVFIPIAEDGHMIERLGTWVLREACREASGWPGEQSVAVNLSPAQFRQGSLVGTVRAALADSGLAPDRLELEITESLLMAETDRIVAMLGELSAMGVRIAMDDFGTGYSSLAYLWRFPFDKVKIDRSFTQALENDDKVDLIVGSIVSLAHSLQIRVNAEGVETEDQLAALREHGCDEFQGFLLGRPASAESTREAIAAAADDAADPARRAA